MIPTFLEWSMFLVASWVFGYFSVRGFLARKFFLSTGWLVLGLWCFVQSCQVTFFIRSLSLQFH